MQISEGLILSDPSSVDNTPPFGLDTCYSGTPSGIVLTARSLGFVILERNNSHERF